MPSSTVAQPRAREALTAPYSAEYLRFQKRPPYTRPIAPGDGVQSMPDNNNELRNDEIRNIVEEVIRYMEGTAWVDRQRHYHDHQLIQELREQKDYDDMRRDYIDRCIAKEQKQAHDRRITRRTIVGGTFVTGMVALLDELVAMCSDVITWVIKLFSGQ